VDQRGVQWNSLHRDLPPGRSVLTIENAPDLSHGYARTRRAAIRRWPCSRILIVSRP
jgi:hypothetical protein